MYTSVGGHKDLETQKYHNETRFFFAFVVLNVWHEDCKA